MPGKIKIIETFYLMSEVHDGDFPRHDVRVEVTECDDVDEAVSVLNRAGVDFASTGTDWAGDPDGSHTVDYGIGREVETSGHLEGWSDADAAAIMAAVG